MRLISEQQYDQVRRLVEVVRKHVGQPKSCLGLTRATRQHARMRKLAAELEATLGRKGGAR